MSNENRTEEPRLQALMQDLFGSIMSPDQEAAQQHAPLELGHQLILIPTERKSEELVKKRTRPGVLKSRGKTMTSLKRLKMGNQVQEIPMQIPVLQPTRTDSSTINIDLHPIYPFVIEYTKSMFDEVIAPTITDQDQLKQAIRRHVYKARVIAFVEEGIRKFFNGDVSAQQLYQICVEAVQRVGLIAT